MEKALYKYSTLFFLLTGFTLSGIEDKEKILLATSGAHTRAFAKENLLTEKIVAEEENVWNELINSIDAFTQKHASSFPQNLTSYFKTIKNASEELVSALKVNYNANISKAIVSERDKKEGIKLLNPTKINANLIDIQKIKREINKLKWARVDLIDTQKKLTKKRLFSQNAKDAREILSQLAFRLEVTIDKVFIDLEKVKKYKEQQQQPNGAGQ